jgi:hypothetical protein
MVSVPAGLLDDDPRMRPSMHVFTSSKAAWVELNDDLQKYDKWLPGFVTEDFAWRVAEIGDGRSKNSS